jgi:RNA polymerase sigma factor for flagellar operon FliA
MAYSKDDERLIEEFLKNRDANLREQLILRYVPLVHYTLARLGISKSSSADYDDLAGQGLLGLIDAADRYDPSFGAQFCTYATLKIRGKILDQLRAQDWLSRSARHRTQAVQKAANELWAVLRRTPSEQELAAHLGMDRQEINQALVDASYTTISLDSFYDFGEDYDTSLYEVLGDENQPDPSLQFDEVEMKQLLSAAILELPTRERLILSLYYYEELTLQEIGQVIGVSESRVCQLHGRAVINLRAMLSQPDFRPAARPVEDFDRSKRPAAPAQPRLPIPVFHSIDS